MSIEKNHPIMMRQVSNGFEVCQSGFRRDDTEDSKTVVFQTFEELTIWLAKHFSHRTTTVKTDRARAE